jgi:hypothetical protein
MNHKKVGRPKKITQNRVNCSEQLLNPDEFFAVPPFQDGDAKTESM